MPVRGYVRKLRRTFSTGKSRRAVSAEKKWTKVNQYISDHLAPSDEALDAALEASQAAKLPAINVSPNQGKLLMLLARAVGARAILEIGTLAGYSTIWLARALAPDGHLITLELNPNRVEIARANVARAGLANRVEVREGPALELLPRVVADGPFDFFHIDADVANVATYFEWALKLSRRGSLIVVDNVVRHGSIIDAENRKPEIQGLRRFYDLVAAEPKVSATAIQTGR